MIIRPVETDDIADLAAFARGTYSDSFGHSFIPSDLADHLGNELSGESFRKAMAVDTFLVAVAEGGLAGFVQFGAPSATTPALSTDDQELKRLYVRAEFRNKGIGRHLLKVALNHPRLEAAERIYVDVWERNLGAKRLYERFGFEVVGAHELEVASGTAGDLDLVMMRPSKPRAG